MWSITLLVLHMVVGVKKSRQGNNRKRIITQGGFLYDDHSEDDEIVKHGDDSTFHDRLLTNLISTWVHCGSHGYLSSYCEESS